MWNFNMGREMFSNERSFVGGEKGYKEWKRGDTEKPETLWKGKNYEQGMVGWGGISHTIEGEVRREIFSTLLKGVQVFLDSIIIGSWWNRGIGGGGGEPHDSRKL